MRLFLGCDPGAKGAICVLDILQHDCWFYPSPGGKVPSEVIFRDLENHPGIDELVRVGIEDVHSLFGMSAKSNFNFGFNAGAAETLLSCLFGPVTKVQPKVWQKTVGITAKGAEIKQAVAKAAHALYPGAALYGPKGGLLDGRADALMIAHYLYLTTRS